ncbi:MAG: ACT domain-containing protein [Candidatus Methanofastidiosia archaeon]
MKLMKQVLIEIKNEIGVIAKVCEILGRSGVNIISISTETKDDYGLIRLVTEDPETSRNALKRKGFKVEISEILVLKVKDKPGELGKLARRLADSKINIESIYLLSREGGETQIAMCVNDYGKARKVLEKHL